MAEETEICDRSLTESSDGEYELQYKPIVTLPEVEVPTHEEEEEVILRLRAKLYRFVVSEEASEWKERGTGELRMLRHPLNRTVRIVMRRDKTLKVCANHFIQPFIDLKPVKSSEKAFVYTAHVDFADETIKTECFAIRFATVEFANLFKDTFYESKKFIAKDCDLSSVDSEEDESEDKGNVEDDDGKELTKKMSELDVVKETIDNKEK